jgi:hypothetical protein
LNRQQIRQAASNPIELPNNQRITTAQSGQGLLQLWTRTNARARFSKNTMNTMRRERIALQSSVLILRTHSRISNKHQTPSFVVDRERNAKT